MASVQANRNKIKAAFSTAVDDARNNITSGFIKLLEFGVQTCLDQHRKLHIKGGASHLDHVGDSYGWILLYGGNEVSRKIYGKGSRAVGNADAALSFIAGKSKAKGWDGYVLAGMLGNGSPQYFALKTEFWVMRQGIAQLKASNFKRYFKTV